MKELICIVCPKGCHLKVDESNNYAVTGNSCERGVEYGKNELINPVRVLTSTVKIEGAIHKRCPVKTSDHIPKGKMFEVAKALDSVIIKSPVMVGDIIIENVAETGVNIISTKSM